MPRSMARASSGQFAGAARRFGIILPVRDKGQAVGQQIAPRLTRRQVAAGQRHRRQPAEMFALAIVDPQALAAPQRAVFPMPIPSRSGQSRRRRPAASGARPGRRRRGHDDATRAPPAAPATPPTASRGSRDGRRNHPLRGKSVNLLHQTQRLRHCVRRPPRRDRQNAGSAPLHRRAQAEGIFHIRAESQQRRHVVKPGGSGSASGT
jgi:hypothetical protein